MKRKIVVKIGGSNLKCSSDYIKVLNKIKNYKTDIVLVLSAHYGITNKLNDFISIKNFSEGSCRALCNDLIVVYQQVLYDSNYNTVFFNSTINELKKLTNELFEKILLNKFYSKDEILVYGEKLSSTYFSNILTHDGINNTILLPEEIGLITDGKTGDSRVDFNSSKNIMSYFNDSCIYIIPGFYGISKEGIITIFGRGGSDYTASVISKLINAEYLDLWKDVDGALSSDPKIIESTKTIARLDYSEASELAYFGAKLLHPSCIEPVSISDTKIRIFNINNSNNLKPHTLISNKTNKKGEIKSITYSNDFGLIKIYGSEIGYKSGVLSVITEILNLNSINIKSVITSQTTINILLSYSELHNTFQLLKTFKIDTVEKISIIKNISTIAIIGNGINEKPGIASKVFSTLYINNINIILIAFGATEVASYFLIKKKDCVKAIKSLHTELFEINNQNIYKNEKFKI